MTCSNLSRARSLSANAGTKPWNPREPSSVAMWTSPAAFARSTKRSSSAFFAPAAVTTRAPCCEKASIAAIMEAIPLPPPTARTDLPSNRNTFPYGPDADPISRGEGGQGVGRVPVVADGDALHRAEMGKGHGELVVSRNPDHQ